MEDHSLYAPQRQSPKAIALILIKYLRIIGRTIWPILLVILINPASGKGLFVTVLVLGIAFLSLVYSLVAYSRFYYFIQDNAVCVRSGVFRKKVINIPFDRIQSVDFKSNLLHQLLHVVSVEVDTAGTKGRELKLDAVDFAHANAMRDMVLAYKRTTTDGTALQVDPSIIVAGEAASPELILSLSSTDLIKVGVSENHIRTAAIIFAFFLGLADDLDQLLGWDVYLQLEHTTRAMSLLGIIATLIAIPFFIFVSFSITLVRTVLKYYHLKFWREGFRFKVVSGLFTRNEKTIQQSKIQVIRWMTSPLKRIFGIYQLNIYQAANVEQHQDKSLAIPGCYQHQVDQTLDMMVPGFRGSLFTAHRMHVRYVILMVFLLGFLPAVLFGWMAWYNHGIAQWLLVLIFPLAVLMGYLYQIKRRFKIHPDFILSEGGIFGNQNKLIEIFKVQSVEIHSSPMQRWRGLSTLHIYSAGGNITFPYLSHQVALQARDYILYRVQCDQRSWM